MEKTAMQVLIDLLEGWVDLRDMAQGLTMPEDTTMDDLSLRIEFLYQMSIRAIEEAKALPHPPASGSRPTGQRGDERTGNGREEGDQE